MGWYPFFMYIYVSEWHGKLSINSGQPQLSWAEQLRAQPTLHPVIESFTLSASGHDLLKNSDCSPSFGQPHLTDIIFSDLRSELPCRSFFVAGRHLVIQAEWWGTLMAQNRPFNQIPVYPVLIDVEWMEKHRNEHRNLSCVMWMGWSGALNSLSCFVILGSADCIKKMKDKCIFIYF